MSGVPPFRPTFFAHYVDKSPNLLPGKFNESRSSLSVLEIFDKMALLGTYLGHLGLKIPTGIPGEIRLHRLAAKLEPNILEKFYIKLSR